MRLVQYRFQCSISCEVIHNLLHAGYSTPSTKEEEKHRPLPSSAETKKNLQAVALIMPSQLRINYLQNSPELGELVRCITIKGRENKEREKEITCFVLKQSPNRAHSE